MPLRILHTADWQIGKPFASVPESEKRARLQQERIEAIRRIADIVRGHSCDLVLVAGDLFDSPTPTKAHVSAMFHQIGAIGAPVIAIPGNHDFGGAGGPWEQDFVRQEMSDLAPNFTVLTDEKPHILDAVVILPAPLLHRQVVHDPTRWIRTCCETLPADRPRIVLAHGSVQGFSSSGDEDAGAATNQLDLEALPASDIDYIALGDWHGTKQVGPKAWYAGTPEPDRFPKGEGNRPGHVLVVEVARAVVPKVEEIPTGTVLWRQFRWHFDAESLPDGLQTLFSESLGTGAEGALLDLELTGHLTIRESVDLRNLLDRWEARLIRLKLRDHVLETPSDEEIRMLTERAGDPLIARVAGRLLEEAAGEDESATVARIALRELYQAAAS